MSLVSVVASPEVLFYRFKELKLSDILALGVFYFIQRGHIMIMRGD